ncbi:MAG: prepilin-type N-terminal cleavage/methylation domain-containing protein [Gammaproteobacteria bacterium]|jgi:prepilin-type N-terminal cleavage/methylation domain-containing protein
MKIKCRYESGFTLIEITIVLLVVAILLGYTVAMFPVQQELRQYRQAEAEMNEIINQLVGFAQINGRLPCPDSIAGAPTDFDGMEDLAGVTSCDTFFGSLPARTLGIDGDYDGDGRLLDPWGQPYGYAVSGSENGTVGTKEFVVPNEIRAVGLTNAIPDLVICDGSAALGSDTVCPVGSNTVAANVAAVIISTGKDRNLKQAVDENSTIQIENIDYFDNGSIPIADRVFVSSTRSDVSGAEFDDVVKWISTNQLFTKMIEADQLP